MLREPRLLEDYSSGAPNPLPGSAEELLISEPELNERDSDSIPSNYNGSQTHKLISANHSNWVFGINWRVLTDKTRLREELRLAREEGATHFSITENSDMVGLSYALKTKLKGNLHSAALHMVEALSQGGLEIYIFELSVGYFSLIALNEMRPIPHFDVLGNEEVIIRYFNEFRALHPGQIIRTIGDVTFIDLQESVAFTEAFIASSNHSILKALLNYNLIIKVSIVVLVVLAAIAFGLHKVSAQYATMLAEGKEAKKEEKIDPNLIYKNSLIAAIKTAGSPALIVLAGWLKVIKKIPLIHSGWKLSRVECTASICTATWNRNTGSYEDFSRKMPYGASKINRIQLSDNPAQALIYTDHPVEIPAEQITANWLTDTTTLPNQGASLSILGSYFQDLSLVRGMKTQLIKSQLFPSDSGTSIDALNMPVVRGDWQISHDLWSIGSLKLPNQAITLNNLIVNIFPINGAGDGTKPIGSNELEMSPQTYNLKGYYYAKAKDF